MTETAIPEQSLEALAAITDPTRLQILLLLGQHGRMRVGDIAEQFEISRPAISHHLKVLKVAGLVKNQREGQEIKYWVDIQDIARELRMLADFLENCCPT